VSRCTSPTAIATASCTWRLARRREAPQQDRPGPRPRRGERHRREHARPGGGVGALGRRQRRGARRAGVPPDAAHDGDPTRLHLHHARRRGDRRHPQGWPRRHPHARVLLAPYGVFGLIFFTTSRFGWGLLRQLGLYVIVVVAGLLIHGTVSLSLLVRLFGGLDPRVFWSRIRASIVTAFSTSSSNATLPTNIAVAEEELKIPPKIAGFVLPLGSTMCMNGTALYEGVTVLFLAQVFGVSLDLGGQIVVLILSVITAVGAAGVPGGSLPLLMVVLATVGVPAEGIAIILGVDRILDMCRTTVNVCGDLTAAVYVARTESDWDPRVVGGDVRLAPAA